MKLRRSLPPTSTPLAWRDLGSALLGWVQGWRARRRFEDEVRTHLGVRHVFAVSSGKAALTLILRALHSLTGKSEVLIPAYTCFSVPSAVVKAGLTVRLCDLGDSELDFDRAALEHRVTQRTLCVIPTHLFGAPANVDRVAAIAHAAGAFVVEDAAQAMVGTQGGTRLGTQGDVGFFSLGRGKTITCGGGGVIVTDSDEIGAALARLCGPLKAPGPRETAMDLLGLAAMTLFSRPWLYWVPDGLPFLRLGETRFYHDFPIHALSGLKAGYLRSWRRRLETAHETRRTVSEHWRRLMTPEVAACPYLRFPVLCEHRDQREHLYGASRRQGLGLSLMYPTPINEIPALHGAFGDERFPRAKAVSDRLVLLPTHQWVSERDRGAIERLLESHGVIGRAGPAREATRVSVNGASVHTALGERAR